MRRTFIERIALRRWIYMWPDIIAAVCGAPLFLLQGILLWKHVIIALIGN